MKCRVIAAVLGSTVILTMMTGCSASKQNETEAQTISILNVETVEETERSVGEQTTEKEQQTEAVTSVTEEPETIEITVQTETDSENLSETADEASGADVQEEEITEASMPETSESAGRTKTQAGSGASEEESDVYLAAVNDRVNVRTEASVSSDAQALLTPGSMVVILDSQEEWTQISYESEDGIVSGYVKSEYLSVIETLCQAAENVNLRSQPDAESEKLGQLEEGTLVPVIGQNGEWSEVLVRSGSETAMDAYVRSDFLKTVSQDTSDENIVSEFWKLGGSFAAKSEEQTTEEISAESERTEKNTETEAAAEESEAVTETEEATESELTTESETAEESELTTEAETAEESELTTEAETVEESESTIESETAEESEIATESETAEDSELTTGVETSEESEIATEVETSDVGEQATETVKDSEPATEVETADESEPVTEAETAKESEPATEVKTADESEPVTEAETAKESEPATETETADESETVTESEKAETSSAVWNQNIAEAQFALAEELVPELANVGVICTATDSASAQYASIMSEIAASSGVEVFTMTIIDEADIDLAASQLVGSVDAVILLDDALVNGLIDTVTAYADEVGIPVIGFSPDHISDGCTAAADGSKRYFGNAELEKLGISIDIEENDQVVVYE